MTEYQQSQQYQRQLSIGKESEKFVAKLLEKYNPDFKCVFPKDNGLPFKDYDFKIVHKVTGKGKKIEVKFDKVAIAKAKERQQKSTKKDQPLSVNLFIEFFNPVDMYASKLPVSRADTIAYVLEEWNQILMLDHKRLVKYISTVYKNNRYFPVASNKTETHGLGFLIPMIELEMTKVITRLYQWD